MPEIPLDLSNPASLHRLVSHLPVAGLAAGTLALLVALITRRWIAQVPALVVIVLMAGSGIWAHETGRAAEPAARPVTDEPGRFWLELHRERAHVGVGAYFILAALALVALVAPLKWPRSGGRLGWLTLLVATVTLAIGVWIALPGGSIRHPETRPPLPIFDDVALPQP